MQTLAAKGIVLKVRSCFDEFEWNDTPLFDDEEDEVNLDLNILSKVPDALAWVYQNCDADLLEDGEEIQADSSNFSIDDRMVGHLRLPSDVMRIISVRLSSWKYAPTGIISERSEAYKLQSDRYACGTWERPVAALVTVPGGRELELYSARTADDTLRYCLYLPVPGDLEEDGGTVSVPDILVPAFIYQVAALTLTAYREELATTFFSLAKERLGIEVEKEQ